jgi:hypothetical protein
MPNALLRHQAPAEGRQVIDRQLRAAAEIMLGQLLAPPSGRQNICTNVWLISSWQVCSKRRCKWQHHRTFCGGRPRSRSHLVSCGGASSEILGALGICRLQVIRYTHIDRCWGDSAVV